MRLERLPQGGVRGSNGADRFVISHEDYEDLRRCLSLDDGNLYLLINETILPAVKDRKAFQRIVERLGVGKAMSLLRKQIAILSPGLPEEGPEYEDAPTEIPFAVDAPEEASEVPAEEPIEDEPIEEALPLSEEEEPESPAEEAEEVPMVEEVLEETVAAAPAPELPPPPPAAEDVNQDLIETADDLTVPMAPPPTPIPMRRSPAVKPAAAKRAEAIPREPAAVVPPAPVKPAARPTTVRPAPGVGDKARPTSGPTTTVRPAPGLGDQARPTCGPTTVRPSPGPPTTRSDRPVVPAPPASATSPPVPRTQKMGPLLCSWRVEAVKVPFRAFPFHAIDMKGVEGIVERRMRDGTKVVVRAEFTGCQKSFETPAEVGECRWDPQRQAAFVRFVFVKPPMMALGLLACYLKEQA